MFGRKSALFRHLAPAFLTVFFLCGFTPAESDMTGLSPEQKTFITGPEWSGIAKDVMNTARHEGVKINATRAIVIAGCIYEEMERPKWMGDTTPVKVLFKRMCANIVLALAADAQLKAQGKPGLGGDYEKLMEGLLGKALNELKADDKQAGALQDLISRHLLDLSKSPQK